VCDCTQDKLIAPFVFRTQDAAAVDAVTITVTTEEGATLAADLSAQDVDNQVPPPDYIDDELSPSAAVDSRTEPVPDFFDDETVSPVTQRVPAEPNPDYDLPSGKQTASGQKPTLPDPDYDQPPILQQTAAVSGTASASLSLPDPDYDKTSIRLLPSYHRYS
jgi:hypothetical protein